jgi:ketosteroid isomerase-like protein
VNNVIYQLIETGNNSDIQSVLNSYADDVEIYPAEKEFTKGIKKIHENYEKLFEENKLSLQLKYWKQKLLVTILLLQHYIKKKRKQLQTHLL